MGGARTPTTPEIIWSPDSSRLLLTTDQGVLLLGLNGRGAQVLVRPPFLGFLPPSFSPDGSRVVYAPLLIQSLFVVPVGGGPAKRIVRDGGTPLWGLAGIAYGKRRAPDLWLVQADGARDHRVFHTGIPLFPIALSSDGRRVLVQTDVVPESRSKLLTIDIPTGHAVRVRTGPGTFRAVGLSRDGARVLDCDLGPLSTLTQVLETRAIDGTSRRVVARGDGVCNASWNA